MYHGESTVSRVLFTFLSSKKVKPLQLNDFAVS